MGEPRVAIVGGGPAGLATAIEARRRGLAVTVFERRTGAPDKACGEGLMPGGVRALERLGALPHLDPRRCAPFEGIRYLQEDGTCAHGRFRDGEGLGIRRTALVAALQAAAREVGVVLRTGVEAKQVASHPDRVSLVVDGEGLDFDALVAADGLASPLRRALGLDLPSRGPIRFGLRRHVEGVPIDRRVEVHWSRGVECYLTPVGRDELGVAFLWSREHHAAAHFDELLARFPAVAERLRNSRPSSEVRGAGPLAKRVRAVGRERIALVGDAAGYLDALTGEGLCLAFASAALLAAELPALSRGEVGALDRYQRAHARVMAPYLRATSGLLRLAERPRLRRQVLRALARWPWPFDAALAYLGGAPEQSPNPTVAEIEPMR